MTVPHGRYLFHLGKSIASDVGQLKSTQVNSLQFMFKLQVVVFFVLGPIWVWLRFSFVSGKEACSEAIDAE
jgi:hypothetical protein